MKRPSNMIRAQAGSRREAFFFPNAEGANLFGIAHIPVKDSKRVGVILCSPFAEEKLNSHRVFYNFANLLASRSFHVLRFDYWGTGDSDGDFERATLASRVQDIISANELFKVRYGLDIIIFVGLRLGANLALKAASLTETSYCIAWAPVIEVYKYFFDLLRINLSTQTLQFKKIVKKRGDLLGDLKAGRFVNIDGYNLTWALFEQAEEYSLTNILNVLNGNEGFNLFLVDIVKNIKRPNRELNQFAEQWPKTIALKIISLPPFWKGGIPQYIGCPESLFEYSLSWMTQKLNPVS